MGSCFNCRSFKGELTPAELHKEFSHHCEEQEYEYGHSSYNGTLSTTSGLKVEDRLFPNRSEAEEYVSSNTDKWGSSLAVRYRRFKKVVKKEPTFGGKKREYDEFKTVQIDFLGDKEVVVPADQLSEARKKKVVEAYLAYRAAAKLCDSLHDDLLGLSARAGCVEKDFTSEDFKSLKRVRAELVKAEAKGKAAEDKFYDMDDAFGAKILVVETHEDGTRWLVGGWAAE